MGMCLQQLRAAQLTTFHTGPTSRELPKHRRDAVAVKCDSGIFTHRSFIFLSSCKRSAIPQKPMSYAGGALGMRGSMGPRWSTLMPVASLAGRPFDEVTGEGLSGRVLLVGLSCVVAIETFSFLTQSTSTQLTLKHSSQLCRFQLRFFQYRAQLRIGLLLPHSSK